MSDRFASYQNRPRRPHSSGYVEEIGHLREMGFKNESNNLKALKKSNGDVTLAIELLIRMPGNERGDGPGRSSSSGRPGGTMPSPSQQTRPQATSRQHRPTVKAPIIPDAKSPFMRELHRMGFANDSLNFIALEKAGGELEVAINYLVEKPQELEEELRKGSQDLGGSSREQKALNTTAQPVDFLASVSRPPTSQPGKKKRDTNLLIDFDDDVELPNQPTPTGFPFVQPPGGPAPYTGTRPSGYPTPQLNTAYPPSTSTGFPSPSASVFSQSTEYSASGLQPSTQENPFLVPSENPFAIPQSRQGQHSQEPHLFRSGVPHASGQPKPENPFL